MSAELVGIGESQNVYACGENLMTLQVVAEDVAEREYAKFGARYEVDSSTVHRDRFCGYFWKPVQEGLADHGVDVEVKQGGSIEFTHYYLETGANVVIDPAWQQWLNPGVSSKNLQKVLVCPRDELPQTLHALGVDRAAFGAWGIVPIELFESFEQTEDADDGWGMQGWGDDRDDEVRKFLDSPEL